MELPDSKSPAAAIALAGTATGLVKGREARKAAHFLALSAYWVAINRPGHFKVSHRQVVNRRLPLAMCRTLEKSLSPSVPDAEAHRRSNESWDASTQRRCSFTHMRASASDVNDFSAAFRMRQVHAKTIHALVVGNCWVVPPEVKPMSDRYPL
jgi:hypothetical protein